MGESIQYLEATPNPRAYIDGWADAQAGGGKIVTLTLRHAPYNPQRNSDLDVWSEVARRLADAGYTPVVVPDTEMALLPLPEEFGGMLQMPVVAFNIELRMALYEKAYANLFVSNGTAMLGMLNKRVRFVQFLSGEWIVDSQRVEKGSGIPYGHSYAYLNPFQHISWANQDADKIIKIFAALARTIDAEGADHRDDLALEPDPGYREPMIDLLTRLCRFRMWNIFELAADWMIENRPPSPLVHRLLGIPQLMRKEQGEPFDEDALRAGFMRAAELFAEQPPAARTPQEWDMWIECLRLLGRRAEAEAALRSGFAEGHELETVTNLLAEILEADLRDGEAVDVYRSFIERAGTTAERDIKLGRALERAGDTAAADETYGRAEDALRGRIAAGDADAATIDALGDLLEAKQRFAEAVEIYSGALATEKSNAGLYLRLGNALQQAGGHDAAIAALKACITVDNRCREAYAQLGLVLENQGRLSEAIETYRAAVDQGIATADVLHRLALGLYQTADYDSAAEIFRWLMQRGEHDPRVPEWLQQVEAARIAAA